MLILHSKVFEAETITELESKLNAWLRPKIQVTASTLHRACPVVGHDTITMVVFYKVNL